MTEERRGQIALIYVRERTRDKGILCKEITRTLGNEAIHLGVSVEEVAEFMTILVKELMGDVLTELDKIQKPKGPWIQDRMSAHETD